MAPQPGASSSSRPPPKPHSPGCQDFFRMARTHIALALGAASLSLFLAFQLISVFGLPTVDYWHWKQSGAWQHVDGAQTHVFELKEAAAAAAAASGDQYLIGVGKADITGPVVELNLMGYANASQIGTGLRQRIYSRAFIVGNVDNPDERFVYLVLDTQSGDIAVRNGILEGLASLGDNYTMYGNANVAVTGTHSHSGPGAWLNYLLPQITSLGFEKASYQAIVDGALLSIQRAQESLTTGTLSVGTTTIEDANINRSLWAYLANPEEERAKYSDNVDKTMTLLRFQRASDGKDMGVLSWFPVHGTSMLGNQTLITGDNKGVAAYLFEKEMTSNSNAAEGFVAGFSQANVGDTSPNVEGAWCEDGSAWGLNDGGTKSCYEIGRRQSAGALDLYSSMDSSSTAISGSIASFHSFADFSNYTFALSNGSIVRTCSAAMGNSFAAGTTDGPGAFDFTQNDTGAPDNPFWNVVGSLVHVPSVDQIKCQQPKPILLDVGASTVPYQWAPNIVNIQTLRVGQLFIIVSPGEATTMSGRRWREAVANEVTSSDLLSSEGSPDPIVVLGGPANTYAHYIATPEEYGVQRYEGASTLYGQHTLDAYINLTLTYLPYLGPSASGAPPVGPSPPDNRDNSLNLITGVVFDSAGIGKSFGDVVTDVSSSYSAGDVVTATFVGANPRNNFRLEGTFAAIEQQDGDTWTQVIDDSDWEIVYEWKRVSTVLGTSQVTITWETSESTAAGTYRVRYYGDSKAVGGAITAFNGTSGTFTIA
ncbi:Neutral alkaline nonlysosomal ceramidase [Neofusicoccum parvum]|uniref:Neutral alkaline nonlysosomal ceramidase n=1 Tax=Neofusicoccum parvum TaxID=310453 RepID=A0ACB5S6U9_9PEZI|nr:Neutral alkaline nonlysosomal ceramidase [Neofusicoccum parvum]GME32809.1 Neutral alkaline nonlysosomal ceramidase [Neofusicoccum parvum]